MTDAQLHASTSTYQRLVIDILTATYSNKQKRQERSREFEQLILSEREDQAGPSCETQKRQKRMNKQLARSLTRFAQAMACQQRKKLLLELGKAAIQSRSPAELVPLLDQASRLIFATQGTNQLK